MRDDIRFDNRAWRITLVVKDAMFIAFNTMTPEHNGWHVEGQILISILLLEKFEFR